MGVYTINILFILFFHWFADFVCQSDYQAVNKSHSFKALVGHTSVYSMLMGMFISFILPDKVVWMAIPYMGITFIIHTAQDYLTSRLNKKLWDKKKRHQFFVSVGFDQFLHFIQLIGLYYLILKYYSFNTNIQF